MSIGSQIRAGAAYVEFYSKDSKFIRSMNNASKRLRKFQSMASNVGAGLVKAGAPFGIFSGLAIKAAAEAEESWNRFSSVFGKDTAETAKYAEDLARDIGRNSTDIQDSLGSFQSMFIGLGFGSQAKEMSKQITALAHDFASFNNLSDDEGIGRFISALSGSAEVLDRYGINTKQAALQQEILRMGINKSWSAVTEQEKALARLNIIQSTMNSQGAAGDALRTAASFTNQTKRFRSQIKDLLQTVGSGLIPMATKAITILNKGLGFVVDFSKKNKGLITGVLAVGSVVGLAGVALIGLGLSAGVAAFAISGLVTIIGALGAAVAIAGAFIAPIVTPLGLVVAGVIAVGVAVGTQTSVISDSIRYLRDVFDSVLPVVKKTFGGIKDALQGGDLKLAAEIGSTGIKLVWFELTRDIRSLWGEVEDFILKSMSKIVSKTQGLGLKAAGFLATSIGKLTGNEGIRGLGTGLSSISGAPEIQGQNREELIDQRRGALDKAFEGRLDTLNGRLSELVKEAEGLKEAAKDEGERRAAQIQPPTTPEGSAREGRRTATGVFNAREASGLVGGVNPLDRQIADSTKKTADSVNDLVRLQRRNSGAGVIG